MDKLGLQLYSVKEAAESDLLGTLEEVASMGYKGAQFAGFFSHSAKEVKEKMEEVGLVAAGAHVQIEELEHDLDAILAYHKEIGNKILICPYLPERMRTTEEDYKQTAKIFNRIGEKVTEAGLKFAYHNHEFEFNLLESKTTGFDLLYEHTDPNLVKMELDCFWALQAGHTPEKIMAQYEDRLISLHLKDLIIEEGFPISTELGNGVLNMKDFIEAGEKHNAEWFIVEQENFTQDPLKSAKENAQYLLNLK